MTRPRETSADADRPVVSSGVSETKLLMRGLRVGARLADRYEILEPLGRGGFGVVYRAQDHELNRHVAVKRAKGLKSFVCGDIRGEAQAIASLSHPNIISIYDLINVGDNELLIVMECPEGETLADHMAHAQVGVSEAVDIAVQIAAALQHAHSRQLVHSDLKPANLFIGSDGRIRLLDFGLAVACFPDPQTDNVGGTPGYMSPEQIRGESHLIDGRADIWALGVVIYQLLAGCRPFVGADARGTYDATLHNDPPPLRQLRPEVDHELQRVVFRCLEKRMSDRYGSASDLIDDLEAWRTEHSGGEEKVPARTRAVVVSAAEPAHHYRSVGLQPFTEQDADSYLSLVPGSRDRSGLPESIQFWKRWVESDDPDFNSPVGVLYGPSGSGKTSFVRAGLIRKLDPSICCVYVECRSGDLGGRITRIVQSRIQEKSSGSSLRELLTRIRTGDSKHRGFRKLLIILDQFESWSQRASITERRDFAEALRQCDGSQIRALVVTRDDFWMGVTELLRWLELPLQEGRNIASVDLIDRPHAMRVLESIGRAGGALPPEPEALTSQQQQFIHQAVDELAIGESVIAVHLVIFAQMSKLREWTPRSLRHSGGVIGACSLYFQELFGSRTTAGFRSPEYRRIAPAVIPILSALLPEDGGPVNESGKTESELSDVTRDAKCQHVFKDCLRVLCEDLRIITVVDDDRLWDHRIDTTELAAETNTELAGMDLRYRLAHDFLTEPIVEWIDRARKRTWRGRKLARLTEISDAWYRRRSHVYMPGFFEYCSLVLASRFGGCNDRESEFIRVATRHHSGRISIAVVALLAFIAMTAVAFYQHRDAQAARARGIASEVDLLLNGPAEDVTKHIGKLMGDPRQALLAVAPFANSVDAQSRVRAQLFLHSVESGSFAPLASGLAAAPAELFSPILDFAHAAPDGREVLRGIVNSDTLSQTEINRAAILLNYLGESDAVLPLLQGSDDFDRDSSLWLEAAQWRGGPEPWIDLLVRNVSPEVNYHLGIILSTFPRDQLLRSDKTLDTSTMINAEQAAVHSAGRFLENHLGRDPDVMAIIPPAAANWRVGPDNIPMFHVGAGVFEYVMQPNSPDDLQEIEIKHSFWISTIPVSRRLYDEFRAATPTLPDGTPTAEPTKLPAMPEDLEADLSQPIFGINHAAAITFCNWLSQREGLEPCYLYEKPTTGDQETDQEPDLQKQRWQRGLGGRYAPLKPPWKEIDAADGYRLPTPEQFVRVTRSSYRHGVPWRHAKTLAQAGGNYAPPSGSEYPRALYALMPNRLGFFGNDRNRGSWVFSGGRGSSMGLGTQRAYMNIDRDRSSTEHSIFLVRLDQLDQEAESAN